MAVFSALAQHPDIVYERMYTKEVNDAGIYLLSFMINEVEHPVIVDSYIPVKWGKPYFTQSQENELWSILLEKAWAKLCGSYAKANYGYVNHAFSVIAGVPNFDLHHNHDGDD